MENAESRLKILTRSEIQELYGFPIFTYEKRVKYFSLDFLEMKELENLRTISSKIHFILQLGYFKAKKRFFILNPGKIKEDIKFILQRYFPATDDFPNIEPTKPTRLSQKACILKLLNYQDCTKEIRGVLQEKAHYLATVFTKPIYIFKELINFLESHHIVLPAYSFMQYIVGKAIADERNRLELLVIRNMPEETEMALDKLLGAEDGVYELTFLKKEARDFSYKEITQELHKKKSLKDIYNFAHTFLQKSGISNENIKYYASLVGYYTVYKLKRMKRQTTYVYLFCFIFNRYQKINDNLINTFIYYVNKYIAEAKQVTQEKVYEYKIEGNKHLKDVGKILELFVNESIPEEIEFQKVKKIAFSILEKEKIPLIAKFISKVKFDEDEYEWNHYLKLSQKFKKNLRPIFLSLDFKRQTKKDPLIYAISFLKDVFHKSKRLKPNAFQQEIISSKLSRYIYDKKRKGDKKITTRKEINNDKYEFLVYRLLKHRLESGEIFVSESLNFKSFEEDLIDNEKWKNKKQLIRSLDLPCLNEPISDILASFKEKLETKLYKVNIRIKKGKNPHIKITGNGDKTRWFLPYKKEEEPINNPIYEQFCQVGISDLLCFVNEQSDFMSSFTHILSRYIKTKIDAHRIFACIVAYGTNIGLSKMAEISDMNFHELVSTANSFIRPETLKMANDKISNAMATLPIFKYYNINEETIHSSSDGQKYETQFDTINSRYSPKYFGLNKGISSYTLVANHIPINAKIIGSNEHEGHYVFDLLFNNTSEIVPNVHSTDTHGINQVNFIILYLFGYMFAPRYKNLSNKAKMIYGFEIPNRYGDFLLKPIRKINARLIEEEWENIQKIIISLALKATTQSTIIRKLSSYARKNRTKKALWELDNIVKTIYILEYVDSNELRRNIQKAINRGESYHKLKRAVFYDNLGKFRVKTELEQQIWSECTRLISNSIIFYNAFILSRLLNQKEKTKRYEEADRLKKASPIAWRHINLYGQYEFYRKDTSIDIDKIINILEKANIWNQFVENETV